MYTIYWTEDVGPFDDDVKRSKVFADQGEAGVYADMLDRQPVVRDLKCSWLLTTEEREALDATPFA